jgi:hypothetical protein
MADSVNEVGCYDGIEGNEAVDANEADADADDDDAFVGLIVVVAVVGKDRLQRRLLMIGGDMMNLGVVDSRFGSGRKGLIMGGRMLRVRVAIVIKDRNSTQC